MSGRWQSAIAMTPEEFNKNLKIIGVRFQREFAKEVGLNETSISRYSTGVIRIPRFIEQYILLRLKTKMLEDKLAILKAGALGINTQTLKPF